MRKKIKNILKVSSILCMISSSALLTGCGSKDNTLPPTPLTKYTPKINIQKRWSNSVGSSSKAYVIGSTHQKKD